MHKTISIPSKFSVWFAWLGQFLRDRVIQAGRVSIAVASDWSARVGKDRKSIVVGATLTATVQLTESEAAILTGEQSVPLQEGAELRLTKPLLSLFSLARVRDGQLLLPEGIRIEIDGLPDPTAESVEITESGAARVHLRGPAGIPVKVDLVPGS